MGIVKPFRFFLQPLWFPILCFGLAILAGAGLLMLPASRAAGQPISWLDALFTATSATCVTGLAVRDTGSFFSPLGQKVILALIQVGGLGIMTLTSLGMYLLRHRITLTDRVAVGQNLLQDPRFHLGRFLIQVVTLTLGIELAGGAALYVLARGEMTPFSALFHSVSAFCNAGFSLYPDSLGRWAGDWPVNLVFMALISLGGIGFFVLADLGRWCVDRARTRGRHRHRLSWYTGVVVKTSIGLSLGGGAALFLIGLLAGPAERSGPLLLTSLFQSVTCRTAGFNTVEIDSLANGALLVMMGLMFIGAAPGSCGGGIKVTTFRVLAALLAAETRGREQVVLGRMAATRETLRRALVLFTFSALIVLAGIFFLCLSETGPATGVPGRARFVAICFEVVSAYGTAGLSTGLTPSLSAIGKGVLIVLMFVGRLGPLVFVGLLQSLQQREPFARPESDLLVG